MKKYLDQDGTKHLVRKLDESITSKLQNKQDKLIAGVNIKIDGNTISSTASYDDTQIKDDLAKKQDKLKAGDNIRIDRDGTISAVSQLKFNKSGHITTAYLSAGSIEMYDPMSGIRGTVAMQPKDGRLITSDDINFNPIGGGRTAVEFNATDLYLVPKSYPGNKVEVWTKMNQGSGSGLDADLLDGKHADQFVLKNNLKISQGSGTFSFKIFNNIESIQWALLNDILFYDIVFASNDDGLMQRVYAGIPLAKLDLPRPLKKKVYLDATNPRDGWVPKMFYIRENGDMHLNPDNPTKTKYIDVTNPYFVKGIAINI